MKLKFVFALLLTGVVTSAPALAQTFPEKPVTLVSTSAAGSAGDVVVRLLREVMTSELGQPLVIENRDGAGGTVAIDNVLGAPADGYTVLSTGAGPIIYNPFLMKSVEYKVEDLTPVSMMTALPTILVVNPNLGVNTLAELVAKAKQEPGTITTSSAGNGTPTHLAAEMFMQLAEIELLHVPYRGTVAAATALLANEVDMSFSAPGNVAEQIERGELVALVVNDDKRLKNLPDVPTASEAGMPDFLVQAWFGLFVKAGTPDAAIEKISEAARKAVADPEAAAALENLGFGVVGSTPQEYKDYLAKDIDRWSRVIEAADIEPQ